MRRILILLAALLIAPAASAGWPEGYQGDEFEEGQCIDFIAEVVEFHDRNPWGMRSPVGMKASGSLCMGDTSLHFAIHYVVQPRCTETPWSGSPPVCDYRVSARLGEPGRILPWVDGAYIAYVHESGGVVPYEAVVWDADTETGRFVDGVFDFVTPLWFYESDDHTRWVWEFKPRQGDLIFPSKRKPAGRR